MDFPCRVIFYAVNFIRVNKIEAIYIRKQQPIAVKASKRKSGKKETVIKGKIYHTLFRKDADHFRGYQR